jgi:exo-1,4-beta-D-glucosaminidase
MHRLHYASAILLFFVATLPSHGLQQKQLRTPEKVRLQQGWTLQSSCKTTEKGEQISSPTFKPVGRHPTQVPSTVMAALVADKTYPDPYFGMNLRSIPGTTYPIATNFAHQPMPDDSPFKCSWWYRTEFSLPANFHNRNVWLHFAGINYRANVWLNGKQVADSAQMAGAYREFEFNISRALKPGARNALAVETFAPEPKDLAINWVDWNPMPPDKGMGLWREVYLMASGPVSLRHAYVSSKVSPGLEKAALTLSVQAANATDQPVQGILKASFGKAYVQQPVELAAGETKNVSFSGDRFPELNVEHPQLWWPYEMGSPKLHKVDLHFLVNGQVSDSVSKRFGIREIMSELDEQQNRVFKINGKRLLIRGGGWSQDMLLRQHQDRLRQEFQYVRHLHLNTIRLEGKMETEEFFNLADEQGILVMAGWCCCDIWEEWDKWQPENHQVAVESLRSQSLRLRSHPSLLVWLYGSDNPPPPDVEREYLDVLKETDWPNPAISSASQTPTSVTGVSGVKMTGPYQYVPPSYWLNPTANTLKLGGAFGFNTETSPGPAIPTMDSLTKMLGKDHLWPIDDVWNYHAGSQEFKDLHIFNNAMDSTYGKAADLPDYLRKAQAMAYDGERAMFEAYRRNKYTSTGVIQWMLNNAWPSTIWHLYDYYLQPAGGFFGARKANEPVHIQFSYDDRSVVVVNGLQQPIHGLKATAELYDFNLQKKFSKEMAVDAAEDSSQKLFTIPEFGEETGTSFVRLRLEDDHGRTQTSNFYWLPAKYSTFDWAATTFEYTPSPTYEDLTQLNSLPMVKLKVSAANTPGSGIKVNVSNPSKSLAFNVVLKVFNKANGLEILPVLWDDNYFELLPGESKTVTALYEAGQLQNVQAAIEFGGWNVIKQTLALSAAPEKQPKSVAHKP